MLKIIHSYCHTHTYLARARVVTACPISAVPAQLLTFPADAAAALALLHVLSLDGGCRNGKGEEGGKDECELHVDWNCGFCGMGVGDGERAWEEGFIYLFNFT